MKLSYSINESMACGDLIAELDRRQVTGVMYHREMQLFAQMLGLKKMAKHHQEQYLSEAKANDRVNREYIEMKHKLIPRKHIEAVIVIPLDWYKASTEDVTPNVVRTYVQKACVDYAEWEADTLQFLQELETDLCDMNETYLSGLVHELVEITAAELQELEAKKRKLTLVGFEPAYLVKEL